MSKSLAAQAKSQVYNDPFAVAVGKSDGTTVKGLFSRYTTPETEFTDIRVDREEISLGLYLDDANGLQPKDVLTIGGADYIVVRIMRQHDIQIADIQLATKAA